MTDQPRDDGAGVLPAAATPHRGPTTVVLALVAALAVMAATLLFVRVRSAGPEDTPVPAAAPDRGYLSENASDAAPVVGGQMVYGVPAETSSFNPVLSSWASYSLTIARAIYDNIASYDENSEVRPFLAERFEHGADYQSWTTTLRPGITYTNGKPFTAESFVAAQRALKNSPVLAEVFKIVVGWEVTGPLTFVMRTTRPWTSYPHAMTSQVGVAVDPDWLESADIAHPIATGPFVVDRWDVNNQMVLKKNPSYWRKDPRGIAYPYLDQVTFKVVLDEAARVEALGKGELDMMMMNYATPAVAQMLTEARAGTFQAFTDKRFETPEDYLLVNTRRPPLDQVEARRALAHALDRADYVATVTGGLDEPADSMWKPGSPWYTPVDYPRYDPGEARRLVGLVKARTGGLFSVTLLGNESTESVRVQQYVQAQWAKVGIDVRLESKPQQTKIINMIQADYDVVLTQQFDNVHPDQESIYWNDWHEPFGPLSLDFARLSDPVVTDLTIEALGATGAVEKEKFAAAARRLAELVPFVFLAHASRTVIASPRLVNVVRARLPGGEQGLEFIQGSHPIHQIWRQR